MELLDSFISENLEPWTPEEYLENLYGGVLKRSHFWNNEVISWHKFYELHRKQQGKCYYTGLEYDTTGLLSARHPLQCSVDRIDSSRGYEESNIALCCLFVNLAKHNWPIEDIMKLWKHLPVDEEN